MSAKAGVNRIIHADIKGGKGKLYEQFVKFINDGKLILGVCNGFQLMVKLGLLPAFDRDYSAQTVTLTFNDSGRFEDRWVTLRINGDSPCVFTGGLEKIYLPVRHGEGKIVTENPDGLERLHTNNNIVMQYSDENYERATMDYPDNPNGSVDAIAGICGETGRIFGLMPHPETYLSTTPITPDGQERTFLKTERDFQSLEMPSILFRKISEQVLREYFQTGIPLW